MKENGRTMLGMVLGFRNGQMVLSMKGIGWIIRHVGLGNSCMLMGMYLKDNGKMIRLMDLVCTNM